MGPRGPDLVPTLPNWLVCVGLMVITHFDLVSGPFWTPGGPKRARFGPNAPFGDLGGCRGALGDQIWSQQPLTGPPRLDLWSSHTLTWYRAPSGPPGARFGPNAPFGDLGGSRGALGDQIWSRRPATGSPGLESWSPHNLTWYQASSGPPGTLKGPFLAQYVPDP